MRDFLINPAMSLGSARASEFEKMVLPLLIDGENILGLYKEMRDAVAFTNKRIIIIDIQGLRGKTVEFSSCPYNKLRAFSIHTKDAHPLYNGLDLLFEGFPPIKFDFKEAVNLSEICKELCNYIL